MTLPIDPQFPFRPEDIREGGDSMVNYMRDLVSELDDKYRDSVDNIDGNIVEYTPEIVGSTIAGTGTYTHQYGFSLRQGIRTHVWFRLRWTAHTGTGNIRITLPYKVITGDDTNFWSFNHTCEISLLTFPAGTTSVLVKAIPSEFYAQPFGIGSGVQSTFVAMGNTGAINGHLFYIGEEDA